MKRIQLPNPCFITLKGIFFFCLELHDLKPFKPKIFWGRTIYNIKTTTSSVCLCREAYNCTKDHFLPTINFYMERRFKPYFCRMERTTKPSFSVVFRGFFFLFFSLVKNFRKVGSPPWQKILDPRLTALQNKHVIIVTSLNDCVNSLTCTSHFHIFHFDLKSLRFSVYVCKTCGSACLLFIYVFIYSWINSFIHLILFFFFKFLGIVSFPFPPPSRREIPGAALVW